MNIIGINHGHNASISLSSNKKIIFAISEERLNRIKNHFGVPFKSLEYCYKHIIKKDDIDYFGLYHNTYNDFNDFFYKNDQPYNFSDFSSLNKNVITGFLNRISKPLPTKNIVKILRKPFFNESIRKRYFSKILDIPLDKIVFINHHKSHAYSASFSLNDKKEWLIFTSDGEGDLECATVYKKFNGKIEKLTSIPRNNSLGYFFYFITKYLGMKPNEHEFKVMALEPYARKDSKEFKRIYKNFSDLFYFSGLDFRSKISTISKEFYLEYLSEMTRFERFDYIAAAAQKIIEAVTIQWIKNWISKTNIKNVALAGGLFMNVKLNQRIYNLDEVDDIYVLPSSGDETSTFGICNAISIDKNNPELNALEDLYLGIQYSDVQLETFVEEKINPDKYIVTKFSHNIEEKIADLLAQGIVVARFNGRMEFGARALGNRSILAHPKYYSTIKKINELIKNRDFWMPFTPSILEEDYDLYIKNPKRIYAPYMTITFDSTELGKSDLSAAIHPYDESIRVQMVKKEWNPSFHRLITEFKKRTGIGGLLNTSFNLHGAPNVCSPEDAMYTLNNSGLTHLSLGNFLIIKKL